MPSSDHPRLSPHSPERIRLDFECKTGQYTNLNYLHLEPLTFGDFQPTSGSSPILTGSRQNEQKRHHPKTSRFVVNVNGQMSDAHWIEADQLTLTLRRLRLPRRSWRCAHESRTTTKETTWLWLGGIAQVEVSAQNDRVLVVTPTTATHPYWAQVSVHFGCTGQRAQFVRECVSLGVIGLATDHDHQYRRIETIRTDHDHSEHNAFTAWMWGGSGQTDSVHHSSHTPHGLLSRLWFGGRAHSSAPTTTTTSVRPSKPNVYEPVLSPVFY